MRARWHLLGIVVAGSLAVGSCAGALAGNFTVTGGLYPKAGWGVPSFGSEAEIAHLPAAAAVERIEPKPAFAGYYYPPEVPVASSPQDAALAASQIDAIYDEPQRATLDDPDAREAEPQQAMVTSAMAPDTGDAGDWPAPPAPSADVQSYSSYSDVAAAED
ncbi:hypothetical protein [Sphingomonas turrisvirgatae]|uniref:SPOR domain-containing protein n=1 Tax=Sphingomonas turrisvirgatae TaxID=1888892 RepID=A0A1E3LY16_9SPHN|nr:hypothetical protein [Sphingomonas turrisvirgatae]ODP37720.1 hypothetical protein BFL28_01725 [Sphingomonas turrisvirgatae]